MTAITWDVLRDLAAFRSATGCAISIYVDLDPSVSPTAPALETRAHSLLSQAEKLADGYPGDHDCRKALREDVERLRRWWNDEFDRDGIRGLAVFASALDGLYRAVPTNERVPDGVRLGRDLYLTPLARTVGRGDGAIVAAVSREEGRVFRLHEDRLVEEVDESAEDLDQTEDRPGQHDQDGRSESRNHRHIEKVVSDHLKVVSRELDRRARAAGGLALVIVAPEELRREIDERLSVEARSALAGWANARAHATPAELLAVARPLIDAARARSEHELLERWREERGRGARAAAGWSDTLVAASDARIDVLLLEDGATREAWQCTRCGRGSAGSGNCPLDGATLERRIDGADVAVHGVLTHGGTIVSVADGALGDAEGIGALLRF